MRVLAEISFKRVKNLYQKNANYSLFNLYLKIIAVQDLLQNKQALAGMNEITTVTGANLT